MVPALFVNLTPKSLCLSYQRSLKITNSSGTLALTSDIPTVPTNNNQLTNGAGYITSASSSLNYISDITPGKAQKNKALVLDDNMGINEINTSSFSTNGNNKFT